MLSEAFSRAIIEAASRATVSQPLLLKVCQRVAGRVKGADYSLQRGFAE